MKTFYVFASVPTCPSSLIPESVHILHRTRSVYDIVAFFFGSSQSGAVFVQYMIRTFALGYGDRALRECRDRTELYVMKTPKSPGYPANSRLVTLLG